MMETVLDRGNLWRKHLSHLKANNMLSSYTITFNIAHAWINAKKYNMDILTAFKMYLHNKL